METFAPDHEFLQKINSIIRSESMNEAEKNKQFRELVSGLNEREAKGYADLIRQQMMIDPSRKYKCDEKSKNKIVAFEYSNLDQAFTHSIMYFNMCYFLLRKLDMYESDDEKDIIRKFLRTSLGVDDYNHIAEIKREHYDTAGSTPVIPDMCHEVVEKIRPSYEQINNSFRHCLAFYDEFCILSKHVFGYEPSIQTLMFIHGVFNNQDEVDNYRIKNQDNISEALYTMPVGELKIMDPYRDQTAGVNVYDAQNPEYEKLFKSRKVDFNSQVNNFARRVKRGDKLVDPAIRDQIMKYRSEIESLDKQAEKAKEEEEYKRMIETKKGLLSELDKLAGSITEDGEQLLDITIGGRKELARVTEAELEELRKQSEDPLMTNLKTPKQ